MKNVLLVDDDIFFVREITTGLDPKKFTIMSAKDGVEGLKLLETFTPDIILLDINMPNMNGIEFLKKTNEKFGRGKIPTLITSNLDGIDQISEGVSLGIRGYIVKSSESISSLELAIEGALRKNLSA